MRAAPPTSLQALIEALKVLPGVVRLGCSDRQVD